MSPHAVNNFVSDLVLMAQAMEKLPQVEADRDEANNVISIMTKQLEALRSDIDQAKAYAATLEQKVRDTEVAKDQAETMFLEADERTSRALDFIKATFGNAGTLIQALEPPRAVEPTPSKPEHIGLTDSQIADGYTTKEVEKPIGGFDVPHYEVVPPVQGQSDPDPIVDHPAPTTGTTTPAEPIAPIEPQPEPILGRFHGLRYHNIPQYVPFHEWIDGGGTEADYHWRPSPYSVGGF